MSDMAKYALFDELQAEVASLVADLCHNLFNLLGVDDEVELPEGFALEVAGYAVRKMVDEGYLHAVAERD